MAMPGQLSSLADREGSVPPVPQIRHHCLIMSKSNENASVLTWDSYLISVKCAYVTLD